jgi:hypothetical protein
VERDTDLAVTLPDGRRVEASLAGRDPTTDIAVLRFAGEAPAIAAAVASDLRPGHLAVAVGRSQGDVIAALGIVSVAGGPWHSSHGGKIDAKLRFDSLALTAEGTLVTAEGVIGIVMVRAAASSGPTIAGGANVKDGDVARGYLGSLQSVPRRDGHTAPPWW